MSIVISLLGPTNHEHILQFNVTFRICRILEKTIYEQMRIPLSTKTNKAITTNVRKISIVQMRINGNLNS